MIPESKEKPLPVLSHSNLLRRAEITQINYLPGSYQSIRSATIELRKLLTVVEVANFHPSTPHPPTKNKHKVPGRVSTKSEGGPAYKGQAAGTYQLGLERKHLRPLLRAQKLYLLWSQIHHLRQQSCRNSPKNPFSELQLQKAKAGSTPAWSLIAETSKSHCS